MWLWQQLRFAKKSKFLTKLLAVSFCLHSIGLFCFLFVYKGYDTSFIQVRSITQDVIVKVLPLGKSMQKKVAQKTGTTVSSVKKIVKKVAPKKTTLVKKQQKKQVKKITPKPVKQEKAKKQQPLVQKKVVQKKQSLDKNSANSLGMNKTKQEKQVKPLQKEVQEVKKEEEVTYVTQKEYSVLAAQHALQEAVIEVWTPPAGMGNKLVCTVALTVDWNGKLKEVSIENSSGILVYDIAVEQALEEVKIPKQLWGKSLTVAFKP